MALDSRARFADSVPRAFRAARVAFCFTAWCAANQVEAQDEPQQSNPQQISEPERESESERAPAPALAPPPEKRPPSRQTDLPGPASPEPATPTAQPEPPSTPAPPDTSTPPVPDPKLWFPKVLTATPNYTARATATRTKPDRRPDTAHVTRVDRPQIDRAPTYTSDGLLRALPSAATFRRSSSLVADPSSQGLNLRGIAPSGVSRTLVLLDGIPLNDPFGGWVYWRAVPRVDIDRIEVVPGGGSALYGTAALGGVVQLYSRPPSQEGVDLEGSYGNLDTLTFSGRLAHQFGVFGAAVSGEWLRSDGYRIVADSDRGPIDGKTPSEHGNVNGRFTLAITPDLQLNANVAYFREVQNGGTRFTTAEVSQGLANVGLAYDAHAAGQFELALFGHRERFGQVRARINDARSMEERASRQSIPAGDEGGSLVWTAPQFGGFGRHQVLAGVDARHLDGTSTDRIDPAVIMPESVVVKRVSAQQWSLGSFLQDRAQFGDVLDLQASLRLDHWRNYDAERELTRANDTSATTTAAARSWGSLNPRLGAAIRALPWLSLRAAGYRAFRAPTLNELYRSFQVGTILTAANSNLGPESLWGGEAGIEVSDETSARARLTGFVNYLNDPIVNATLPAPMPDGSTRQRQNLGSARIAGFELDARYNFDPFSRLQFSYTFARSEVTDAGANRALVGKRLAQDPEHRATISLALERPAWFSGVIQLRVIGPQWEDDLNTLSMHGYALLDATIARRLGGGLELFVAGENILGTEYLVGRAGVDTQGAPFTFRVGLRLRSRYRP